MEYQAFKKEGFVVSSSDSEPPSPPRRKRSKAAEQAVETAEGVLKRKLPDLGEFNSLLGPE